MGKLSAPHNPTKTSGRTVAVGVLALQGDVREHLRVLAELGAEPHEVRTPADLDQVEALVIPGGESTTIGRLAHLYGLLDPLARRIDDGMAVLGTCAGLILLATDIADSQQPRLSVLDITVDRNAYGPQNESFETLLSVAGWDEPIRAVFIRAPIVKSAGTGVEKLAEYEERPVLVRQDRVLAATFHPELTGDLRIHSLLLDMIGEN